MGQKDENNVMMYRKLYNALYNVNQENVPWGFKDPDLDLVYFVERLRFPPNSKVLDAGCGNGKNSVYLKGMGFEVHGFDISEKAVAVAKERVPLGHFIIADAKNLPYMDDCFDIIVDVGLLHCIPPDEQDHFKNEVFRVLRSKGYYFLREFCRPPDYPPEKPLFYENTDQTGRTFYEKDPTREQIPTWSFTLPQIRTFFREFKIENELYSGNRVIVLMSKKDRKIETKSWLKRIARHSISTKAAKKESMR